MLKKLTEDKLEEALNAGIGCFARGGYDKVSMKSVADEVGISVGVLYKYYKNKEEFFFACVDKSIDVLQDTLNDIYNEEGNTTTRVEDLLRKLILFSKMHKNEVILYNEITSSGYSMVARELVERIEIITAAFYGEIVKNLMEENRIRKDINPRIGAFFFDNILMMLQFSYSVEYYKERMKIYVGEDCFADDDKMVKSILALIEGAFRPE